jgi:hypothetical protein
VAPGQVFGTPPNQLAFSASGSPALVGQLSASMGHRLLGIYRHRKGSGRTGTEASWPSASSRLISRGQRSISVSLSGVRVQFRDATDAASLTCQPEERPVQATIKPGLNMCKSALPAELPSATAARAKCALDPPICAHAAAGITINASVQNLLICAVVRLDQESVTHPYCLRAGGARPYTSTSR